MNKPIRTLSIFCMVMFMALLANVTYLQYFQASELNDSTLNRRVIVESFSRERGAILVDRNPVAESVKSGDEFEFQRRYDRPRMYAHLTGWFSYFSQSGIEKTQNAVLSGDDSRLFVTRLVDMMNNSSPKGGSVALTIDPDAQQAAFDGLESLGDDVQGAVAAIEPSTGKVLAMVSAPTFDPNELASHDLGQVSKVDKRLNDRDDQPKLNRAISTTLPPGSTFKLVTAAAALETGDYDADSMVPGGSSYTLPHTSTSIDNGGRDCGTDKITMSQALEQSCNTTFLALANELGQKKMLEQAEAFGFNDTSLEDLPGQAASVYPTQDLEDSYLAQTGMGQYDVRSTPLQMAMVVAGIVNDGTVMRPYLVDEVRSPDLDLLDKTDTKEISDAVSSGSASELRTMMQSVVTDGTASVAAIPDVEVGAKTGTAESCDDCNNYAWFVSYASAGEKQVAVAVMIQNVNLDNSEIAGGAVAGPIAKSVMEAIVK